jgi:hypothetical protein
MSEKENDIRKEFTISFNKKGKGNTYKIDAIANESQNFEKEGVHLTRESGLCFVNNLLDMAEGAFESELVEDVEDEGETIFSKVKNAGKVAAEAVKKANLLEMKRDTTDLKLWRKNF